MFQWVVSITVCYECLYSVYASWMHPHISSFGPFSLYEPTACDCVCVYVCVCVCFSHKVWDNPWVWYSKHSFKWVWDRLNVCVCVCVCVLWCVYFQLFFCVHVNPTNRSPPTRSRPRSRSTPQRCAVRGWWPRRFRRAPSSPAAPAAPAPSLTGCLKRKWLLIKLSTKRTLSGFPIFSRYIFSDDLASMTDRDDVLGSLFTRAFWFKYQVWLL